MDDFKEACLKIREALKVYEGSIRNLYKHPDLAAKPVDVVNETATATQMRTNITLAFRHLEDCRMRLGKAIQAFDQGVSVYPR